MEKLGIIDIGSNSIRLVILKINEDNSFRIIDEKKESVRLGMEMTEEGGLNLQRVEKAMDTLRFFMDIAKATNVNNIIAVATEAVRRASNREYFVERAKNEIGIDIRVLQGNEEAFYDYFGTVNSMEFDNALLMDIGGCSNQLILVENRKMVQAISLPYGAINLSETFKLQSALDKNKEDELKNFLLKEYSKVPWIKNAKGYPLIGIGGTIRNIGKIARKKNNYPMDVSHNYHIDSENIYEIYDLAKSRDIKQREKIKGLSKERADIFLGAAAAVVTVMESCNASDVYISGNGLREGIIYEYILKGKEPIEKVLDFSLNNIMCDFQLDISHAKRVRSYTETLFEQLKPVHNISQNVSRILKTTTLLHDLGIDINYYGHHKHSFYMMLNSRINGLTHREQLMAAHIAAFHRREEFKIDTYQYRNMLHEDDISVIQKIGVLLKISECLDQRQNGNIEQIQCNLQTDTVIIKLFANSNPEIEINDAIKVADMFHKLFNKKLLIV